ncbi:MAG: PDZ domain-containing protein [Acidaminococcaceae bacterium]|nr:PDZ domain-containing protein [Acidaminococcaceae bacterium]
MKKTFVSLLLVIALLLGTVHVLAEDVQIGYANTETKIYMSASEKGVVDGTVDLGTQVRVEEELLAEGTGWYRVTILSSGKTGWIPADDIDLVIAKKPITRTDTAPERAGVTRVTNEHAYPVLTASGLVDPDTLPGAPDPSQYHLIEIGTEDSIVPAIKARLNELGFNGGSKSEKFTKDFVNPIKSFQRKNGLTEDGICSPEFQAALFSLNAKNSKGITPEPADPIAITQGNVKSSGGRGTISFTVKNQTGAKVDAFDFRMKLYSTYGERFLLSGFSDKVTLTDEVAAFDMSEERTTINRNSSLQISMGMGDYYFAGCMIAITAYHTEDGKTVVIPDDELHWFAFGKGVEKGYQTRLITPLTETEKQLASDWLLGVKGLYVDDEIAEAYSSRGGFMITSMTPDSPADAAGLQTGDVLLAIGDVRIFGSSSLDRARAAIAAGDTVDVLFYRNGAVWVTQLTRPSDEVSL